MSQLEPEIPQRQSRPRRSQQKRRSPVMGYLAILFAVAFLLLLWAYFQQQRSNTEATDALKQSASAVQSIQNLIADNDSLRQENEALKEQIEDLSTVQQEKAALESQVTSLGRRVEAMQYFWQIDDYYARKFYTQAKELIQQFEALGLKEFLDQENTTGTDRFSPAARYQEIYDALY